MSLNQEIVKIKNLSLAAKLVSEQVALGLHKSQKNGLGVEFEQYRHYQPGDDPKHIDWKLYARTQKHQVRVSTTESRLQLKLILDISGSMNYTESQVKRIDFAKVLLASIGYMAYRQNDALQLYFLGENGLQASVNQQKQAFQNIIFQLEKVKAGGKIEQSTANILFNSSYQKELIIVVSDFLNNEDQMVDSILKWAVPGKEIIVLHVLGQKEINPDFEGIIRFKDLESDSELEIAPAQILETYKLNVTSYLQKVEQKLTHPHIHYNLVYLDSPIAEVLIQTLKKVKWNL